MAFKARLEFWKLSTGRDGLSTVVLDQAIADAVEIDTDMVSAADVPELENHAAYAMSATAISGAFTSEVADEPTAAPARGRVVLEGQTIWFIIRPGQQYFVAEYPLA